MEAVTPSGQQRDDMGLLVRGNALRMRGREGHGRKCTEERISIVTSLIGHSLSGRINTSQASEQGGVHV